MASSRNQDSSSSRSPRYAGEDSLIPDLLENIAREPGNTISRSLLMEVYAGQGDMELARQTALELLEINPNNAEAQNILDLPNARPNTKQKGKGRMPVYRPAPANPTDVMEKQLVEGYPNMREWAKQQLEETKLLSKLADDMDLVAPQRTERLADLQALVDGRLYQVSSLPLPTPPSVMAASRIIERDVAGNGSTKEASQAIKADLLAYASWLMQHRADEVTSNIAAPNSISTAVGERAEAFHAALPNAFSNAINDASTAARNELQ